MPRRLLIALLALGIALAGPAVTAAPAQAAVALPWGKSTYVVSMIGGKVNAIQVRLAAYRFGPDGVVTQEYWTWRQNAISGDNNARWTKPNSGYTTSGCLRQCPIKTPYGFQSGRRGRIAQGSYSMSRGVLSIRWNYGGSVERWKVISGRPGVVGIRQLTTSASARGWGLGSNAALTAAVDARTLYDTGYLRGPRAENIYGRATTYSKVGFQPLDHTLCSTGECIQAKRNTSADKRSWYSSYYATNPAKDGRKVFHNHQWGYVTQMESPGSTCISPAGGHTEAMLQALDDQGRLVGVVGVEASMNQRKPYQDVMSAFAMAKGGYVLQGTPLVS